MVYPADQESAVFYNPVQVQNRDLSTLMIALYIERRRRRMAMADKKKELRANQIKGDELQRQLEQFDKEMDVQQIIQSDGKEKGIHILDALAASGLRSIRYWKELVGVQHITINDLDPAAVERAHANIEQNALTDAVVSSRTHGIRIQNGDATHEMYQSRRTRGLHAPSALESLQSEQYDVIDLDPYGSAAPFLDGAVQAISNGGMLNVTCTDMAALGGSHPETCYGRYGSMPLQRAAYLQEVALRILLKSLAETAAKYGRTIRPILSVGMDFYIRCFVEVYDDKAGINDLSLQIGSVFQSSQCSSFLTLPHGQHGRSKHVYQSTRAPSACEETGAPFKVVGPMWLAPMHDRDVVLEALARLGNKNDNQGHMKFMATRNRLEGLLTSVSEELPDVPLYYTLPDLCHVVNCCSPTLAQVRAAIVNAGYRVSGYHKEPQAIKTDAPNRVVWDVMRAWCKANPPKISKKKQKKLAANETDNANGEPKQVSAADKILAVEPSIEVDFTVPKGGKGKKVSRFPQNPEKNWGPKKAASGKRKRDDAEEPQLDKETT